jgi:hypothetical protein
VQNLHGESINSKEYQAMQENIELLEDIQTSITQLAEGKDLTHDRAECCADFW